MGYGNRKSGSSYGNNRGPNGHNSFTRTTRKKTKFEVQFRNPCLTKTETITQKITPCPQEIEEGKKSEISVGVTASQTAGNISITPQVSQEKEDNQTIKFSPQQDKAKAPKKERKKRTPKNKKIDIV
jgi:hypothetical protein